MGGTCVLLEKYRPPNMLAHKQSVFMCDDPDVIDLAGGGTEWLFEVEPLGVVQRHDQNWWSLMDCLISEGCPKDSEEIEEAANNYWEGVPHGENVWEYLTPQARILSVDKFEL